MKILFFDTETTGLFDFKAPVIAEHQPRLVQIATLLSYINEDTREEEEIASFTAIQRPDGYTIPVDMVHGISHEHALDCGISWAVIQHTFDELAGGADLVVCHNYKYDSMVWAKNCHANDRGNVLISIPHFCTMEATTNICQLPGKWKGGFKWPKLAEAYDFFFGEQLVDAHDALADVRATKRLYLELLKMKGQYNGSTNPTNKVSV